MISSDKLTAADVQIGSYSWRQQFWAFFMCHLKKLGQGHPQNGYLHHLWHKCSNITSVHMT